MLALLLATKKLKPRLRQGVWLQHGGWDFIIVACESTASEIVESVVDCMPNIKTLLMLGCQALEPPWKPLFKTVKWHDPECWLQLPSGLGSLCWWGAECGDIHRSRETGNS